MNKILNFLYRNYHSVVIILTYINLFIIVITQSIIPSLIYAVLLISYMIWYECYKKTMRYELKGEQGPQGPKGDKGDPGNDYVLTEDDKHEISELSASIVETLISKNIPCFIATGTVSKTENELPNINYRRYMRLPKKGKEIWYITNDLTIDHMIVKNPEEDVKKIYRGCCYYESEDVAILCLNAINGSEKLTSEEMKEIFRIKQEIASSNFETNGCIYGTEHGEDNTYDNVNIHQSPNKFAASGCEAMYMDTD